ncbi:hypothetical protein B0O99DRAFT_607809 [Bisporella sp. PMI_857]|nr:hypothetical protein B0O99DRAFT_607809 [Bisporella sp. PMI_857]
MSTIEPRLISLLNKDAPYESSPSLELPPLQDPNILKASGRPLLLEPDASKRDEKLQHANLISSGEKDNADTRESLKPKRALGNSSPQALRKILSDDNTSASAQPSKKRNIVESSKDDFVQLPQPPKKQKAAKQVVPPIIIGLFEPPPQAALFPPIASSSFHDSHGRNSLNTVPPNYIERKDTPIVEDIANSAGKRPTNNEKQKRDVKARKKWTEEETNNLLLGVHKHGVGRWSDILDDPSFKFNKRSGVDLKDRFRTCCPNELWTSAKGASTSSTSALPKRTKSSLENILIDDDALINKGTSSDSIMSTKSRKSRAQRKKVEDLVQLGIEGPFRKSQRRERRPFTEEDDREIIEGYDIYGPQWTRIQRDPRFHLQSRQATDLRDRLRNKYPEKFRSEDSASKDQPSTDGKEKETSVHPPSAHMLQPASSREGLRIHEMITEDVDTTSKILPLQPSFGMKENFTFPDQPVEHVDNLPSFDWNANAPFTSTMQEMEISRLLLDDEPEPWMESSSSREKQQYTDINSILSSSADGASTAPYYTMLLNDEPINIQASVPLDSVDTSFG